MSSCRVSTMLLLSLAAMVPGTGNLAASPHHFEITGPPLVLTDVSFGLEIHAYDAAGRVDTTYHGSPAIQGVKAGSGIPRFSSGKLRIDNVTLTSSGMTTVTVRDADAEGALEMRSVPALLSIVPPLVAILFALFFRDVILALVAGVWVGAIVIYDYNPFVGLLRLIDQFVVGALAHPDHAAIIIFTLLFGGMVGVISRNGGMQGIARILTKWARSRQRGQLATWFLGIVIFFDDYANALIVGNTMRPVTDKLKVSREKLAYIVDATSAPVASLFFISSWIGYEVGLIDDAIKAIGYVHENAYWLFIDSIAYRFYPIFALVLGFTIAASGRDFGSMLSAERRAWSTGKLFGDGAKPATDLPTFEVPEEKRSLWNGLLPILTVIVAGMVGLYQTGYAGIVEKGGTDFSLSAIIGASDSYKALQWAAFASCLVAIVLSVGRKVMTLTEALEAWVSGIKSMMLAMIILILAWSIGEVTVELKTADYLVQVLKGNLSPHLLPVLTFLVAGVISFATGTSWGTMGILMPLVIPLSVSLSQESGLGAADIHVMLIGTISSVLAGAVAGDHCSPISDTTILSSTAASCDHIDHVRTQLPYALLAAVTGMLVGDIPTAYGVHPVFSILAGSGVLIAAVFVIGRRSDGPSA